MKFNYLSQKQKILSRVFTILAMISGAQTAYSLQLHSFKCVKQDKTEVKINADQITGSYSKRFNKYYIGLEDYRQLLDLCGDGLSHIEAKRRLWFFPSFMFSYHTISPLKGDRQTKDTVDSKYMPISGLAAIGAGAAGVVAYINREQEIPRKEKRAEKIESKEEEEEETNQAHAETELRYEPWKAKVSVAQVSKKLVPEKENQTINRPTIASEPKGIRFDSGGLLENNYKKFSDDVCSALGIGSFRSEPAGLLEEVNILVLDDHGRMLQKFLHDEFNLCEEAKDLIKFVPSTNEEIANLHDISTDEVSAFKRHGAFHKLEINAERISEITEGQLQFELAIPEWADGMLLTWDSHVLNRKINFYIPRYFYLDAITSNSIARRLARTEKHFASHTPRILNALQGKTMQGVIGLLDGHLRATHQKQGSFVPERLETVIKFFPKHPEGCFEQLWDPRSQFFPKGTHYSVHLGRSGRAKVNGNFFEDFSEASPTNMHIQNYDLGYVIKTDVREAIREILRKQEGFRFINLEDS